MKIKFTWPPAQLKLPFYLLSVLTAAVNSKLNSHIFHVECDQLLNHFYCFRKNVTAFWICESVDKWMSFLLNVSTCYISWPLRETSIWWVLLKPNWNSNHDFWCWRFEEGIFLKKIERKAKMKICSKFRRTKNLWTTLKLYVRGLWR